MPHDPPILDYAPPPPSLPDRTARVFVAFYQKWAPKFLWPIGRFFFVRPVRAIEATISSWVFVCGGTVLLAVMDYYGIWYRLPFSSFRRFHDVREPPENEYFLAVVCFFATAATARMFYRRKWRQAAASVLVFALLAPVAGFVQFKWHRHSWWMQLRLPVICVNFPLEGQDMGYEREPHFGLWWVEKLPGCSQY